MARSRTQEPTVDGGAESRPRILLVDDDHGLREPLAMMLEESGFQVGHAASGAEMERELDAGGVDLILLDLLLPDGDGLALCQALRAKGVGTPIIILTARDDRMDRITGLETGADDYMVKPVDARELLARIRAVLRRAAPAEVVRGERASRTMAFAGWRLDTATRELTTPAGDAVTLSSAEFELLLAFLEHPQTVLSRERLRDLTGAQASIGFERSIDVQVSRLRRKIGDDAKSGGMIKTVWGGGYLFTPDLAQE